MLKDHTDTATNAADFLGGLQGRDFISLKSNFTRRRLLQKIQTTHQCRLTRTTQANHN
ncbi:hypothetical protein D3C87_1004790 [compost metagenome]